MKSRKVNGHVVVKNEFIEMYDNDWKSKVSGNVSEKWKMSPVQAWIFTQKFSMFGNEPISNERYVVDFL